MKSGATFLIGIASDIDDIKKVESVIFTIRGKEELQKNYPEDVAFDEYHNFLIPLTQEETTELAGQYGHKVLVEGQVNFVDKSVNKTETVDFFISGTLATEIIEGNTPSAYPITEVSLRFMDGIVVADLNPDAFDEKIEQKVEELTADMQAEIDSKVEKVEGKGLSTNDFTNDYKEKVDDFVPYDDTEIREEIRKKVDSVNGKTGVVTLSASDVGAMPDDTDLTRYALVTESGYDLGLSIDSKTYVMTIELKNIYGNVLSSKTLDFPIESMVVGAEYNSGKIILTLQNGQTLDVDISSIVGGLVNDTFKIAGIDMKDDISANELKTALAITKSDVGLPNVDNTSDANKPVSTATQTELSKKVDKVSGKSLVDDTEITRLSTLEKVSANPSGTESASTLNALQIGNTKYKIPSGGSGSSVASDVALTPTSIIPSTNVQAAFDYISGGDSTDIATIKTESISGTSASVRVIHPSKSINEVVSYKTVTNKYKDYAFFSVGYSLSDGCWNIKALKPIKYNGELYSEGQIVKTFAYSVTTEVEIANMENAKTLFVVNEVGKSLVTSEQIEEWNNKVDSSFVPTKIEANSESANNTSFILFSADNQAAKDKKPIINNNFTINPNGSSDNFPKFTLLVLGSSVSDSECGILRLRDNNTRYSQIVPLDNLTANRTLRMPNTDGTISVTTSSSRKYKENIKPITEEEAKKILDVNIVSYDYINKKMYGDRLVDGRFGVIAEELNEIIPSSVLYDNEWNPDAVDYSSLVPHLIKMVQMQQHEIEELKKKL